MINALFFIGTLFWVLLALGAIGPAFVYVVSQHLLIVCCVVLAVLAGMVSSWIG